MNNGVNKVFVSAQLTGKTKLENDANHAQALQMLSREGIQFGVVEGVYKNNPELSFMLYTENADTHAEHLEIAQNLGTLFRQEALLEVANDGTAFLQYIDTRDTVKIGQFVEATEKDAKKRTSYTFEPNSGRYFIVD